MESAVGPVLLQLRTLKATLHLFFQNTGPPPLPSINQAPFNPITLILPAESYDPL